MTDAETNFEELWNRRYCQCDSSQRPHYPESHFTGEAGFRWEPGPGPINMDPAGTAEQLPPAQNPRQPYAVTSTSAADRFAGPFHCTYPTCEADVNDRTFEGKGAKAAYKRHMDGHEKPYICPKAGCPRNKNGFSRRDNLNVHRKTHGRRRANRDMGLSGRSSGGGGGGGGGLAMARSLGIGLGTIRSGRVERRDLSKRERRVVRLVQALLELLVEDEDGDDGADDEDDDDDDDDDEGDDEGHYNYFNDNEEDN